MQYLMVLLLLWIAKMVQSVKAVEYTNCISAEGKDSPYECPGYDTKQSDGEAPIMLEF